MGIISRWWRSLGFGIHSPFAYRFIREVITETLPYYDYDRLPSAKERLAYRIAAFLRPTRVYNIGKASTRPVRLAHPASSPLPPGAPQWTCLPPMPLILAGPSATLQDITDAISIPSMLLAQHLSADAVKALRALPFMTFDNGSDSVIIAAHTNLYPHHFSLKF